MMIKFAYFLYGLNYFLSNRYINIWVFLKYNLKSLTKISTKIFRGHDSVGTSWSRKKNNKWACGTEQITQKHI